jgi:SP family general alpha glucoside:H+ symporter-like MFS transporter
LTTMATEKRDEPTDLRIEDAEQHLKHLENVDLHDKALNASAREATAQEHSIGFIQGFKTYKRAAMWSFRECTPGQAFRSYADQLK